MGTTCIIHLHTILLKVTVSKVGLLDGFMQHNRPTAYYLGLWHHYLALSLTHLWSHLVNFLYTCQIVWTRTFTSLICSHSSTASLWIFPWGWNRHGAWLWVFPRPWWLLLQNPCLQLHIRGCHRCCQGPIFTFWWLHTRQCDLCKACYLLQWLWITVCLHWLWWHLLHSKVRKDTQY